MGDRTADGTGKGESGVKGQSGEGLLLDNGGDGGGRHSERGPRRTTGGGECAGLVRVERLLKR